MEIHYSNGRQIQILISVLKGNGIRKVIVSPGTQNIEFVGSIQQDPFFELFSCVDERSAAYMACGMAAESGEAVVITCTEATASRDYLPGLTEAYHRKLPVLAVTCLHDYAQIGNLNPQVINRSVEPIDALRYYVDIHIPTNEKEEQETNLKINKAVLELFHHGGGPVRINLPSSNADYQMNVETLPPERIIKRFSYEDLLPSFEPGRIAIFIGSHRKWSQEEINLTDLFCKEYDAVVFCDKTSQYTGEYGIYGSLMAHQTIEYEIFQNINTLIHIGEETGDTFTLNKLHSVSKVWRVSEDGELRDTFHKLQYVFEMKEKDFFTYYCRGKTKAKESANLSSYMKNYQRDKAELIKKVTGFPFSNIFIASSMLPKLPCNAILHLGMSNTIRAWTFFEDEKTAQTFGNLGCRGIDGNLSAMLGASFINTNSIFFLVTGDLSFFYDINALGNRHIGKNVRILLINNGCGNLFKTRGATAYKKLGEGYVDPFVSATGHFGNKSKNLVKHFSEDLGFEYLSADSKEVFLENLNRFLTDKQTEKPMVFEVFTEDADEREAFSKIRRLKIDYMGAGMKKLTSLFGSGQKK